MPDNVLSVETRVNVDPLEQLKQKQQQVAQTTIDWRIASDGLKATLKAIATGELPLGAQATKALAEAQSAAAAATAQLKAAQQQLSPAVSHTISDMTATSGVLRTVEGGMHGSIRAAERFIATTLGLGGAMQLLFPIFGAISLIEVFGRMGGEAYELWQNVVNLKKANEDLDQIDLKLAEDSTQVEAAIERQRIKFIELTKGVAAAREAEEQYIKNKPIDLSKFFNDKEFRDLADRIKLDTENAFKVFSPAEFDAKIAIARQKVAELQDVINNPQAHTSSFSAGRQGTIRVLPDEAVAKAQLRLYQDILKQLTEREELYNATVKTDSAETTKALNDEDDKRAKRAKKAADEAQRELEKYNTQAINQLRAQKAIRDDQDKESAKHTALIVRDFQEQLTAEQRAIHQAAQSNIQMREAEEQIELTSVQQQKDNIETLGQLHIINSRRQLALVRQNAEAEFQIRLKSLQDRIAIEAQDPESNPAKIAKLYKDIEKLKTDHERNMNQITNQSVIQQKQRFDSYFSAVSQGFKTQLTGVLQGTQTIGQAINNLWQGIMLSLIEKFVDMGLQWAATHLFMKLVTKTSGISQIASAAAQAGANAYAATAIIPIVGPELAPAAAATAYAGAISFEGLNTFARGGIVPSDSLAFVHKNEMVLPASIAAKFIGGGGGRDLHVHHHGSTVNAIDGRGVVEALQSDQKSLIRFIRQLQRDGHLK